VDAYDEEAWGETLASLADLPRDEGKLAEMRERGLKRAALYRQATLQPRWERMVLEVAARHAMTTLGGAARAR
jgi:hypothetical protein